MNRKARRKADRQMTTDQKQVKQALDITHSIAKMVASGAMETHFDDYALYIEPTMFWVGKGETHHTNFSRSMLTYFNMNNGRMDENEHDKLEVYNIESGLLLATYNKETGLVYAR